MKNRFEKQRYFNYLIVIIDLEMSMPKTFTVVLVRIDQ